MDDFLLSDDVYVPVLHLQQLDAMIYDDLILFQPLKKNNFINKNFDYNLLLQTFSSRFEETRTGGGLAGLILLDDEDDDDGTG